MKNPFRFINDLIEKKLTENNSTEDDSDLDEARPTMSEEATRRLSKLLSLDPEKEFWGIWNSDEDRLEEFMTFYESYVSVEPMELEELAHLILQSAEDGFDGQELDNDPLNQNRMVLVALFVQAHHLEFPGVIESYVGPDSYEGSVATIVQYALLDRYGQRPDAQQSDAQGSE